MNDTNEIPQDVPASAPNAPVAIDLKRRMRELLSIPDSQRSDEQWDELIEIEIQLAPGNRVGGATPQQGGQRGQGQRQGSGNVGGGGGGGAGGGGSNWKRHGPGRKGKPGGGKKPQQGNPPTGS